MRLENNRNNKNKTNVYILGDSIVKNLNGYLLTKKIRHKHLVKVRLFSGAKISCMRDHVKLTLRDVNPDHIVLRAGTNDLRNGNLRLKKNVNRLICAQLNMNSIRNKFESLVDIINNNIDILMISENWIHLFRLDSFTFMAFLNLIGSMEMVTVVEYFCIFVKIHLQN